MGREQQIKSSVEHLVITADQAGRRIDNYLLAYLKDVPKTRIYRMLRKGEVRVNRSRVKQDYKLIETDVVRIPPIFHEREITRRASPSPGLQGLIYNSILYEDDMLLVLNKPAGMAVHSGTNEPFGLIEILRSMRPVDGFLELVHRLDKSTSGCLLIARHHRVLRDLHKLLKGHRIKKTYLALLKGKISRNKSVSLSLAKQAFRSGQHRVQVHGSGKAAVSRFKPLKQFDGATLVRVEIDTGRTHQIRVHAEAMGHPVAGDDKYGDREFNKKMKQLGLKRMFLHAESLAFKLPDYARQMTFKAPLPEDLEAFLEKL